MANGNDKAGLRLRKSKTCHERFIKVTQIHYEYRTKEQSSHSGARSMPWIQMQGHWLRQAAFDINTPVKIRVMEGFLVLTISE